MRFVDQTLFEKDGGHVYEAFVPPEPKMREWPKWMIEVAAEKFPEHREELQHSWSPVFEKLGAVHVTGGFDEDPPAGSSGWLDHWGTANYLDHEVLVSEPYHPGAGGLRDLLRFCDNLGLGFTIQAGSWHYSTHAMRIIVWRADWNIPDWWQQRAYLYAGEAREAAKREAGQARSAGVEMREGARE